MNSKKTNDRVKILLEDMSFSSSYQILEWGKDDDELKSIASKKNIQIPSKDLAIFKCKYAMVDQENRNGCSLPKKEVKKALISINGKAIDKDHLRKSTVGHWLEAKLEENDIVAYGCFWKSNFPEDYGEIKKRMSEGKVKISFEAWGERKFKEDGSYELMDIEFAGGALLFDTEPAFPDAEVMEFSSTNRVLEFAKIIEESEDDKLLVEGKLDFNYDVSNIARIVYQHECVNCKAKGWQEVQNIDFENSKIKHKCVACGQVCETDMTPKSVIKKQGKKIQKPVAASEEVEDKEEVAMISLLEGSELIDEDNKKIEDAKKLTYKDRKKIEDDMFAVIVNKDGKKIRMFPVHDPAHVRNALARLPQAKETLNKLGISLETVKNKILKRAKELNMTELLKRHEKGGIIVESLLRKYNKASEEELIKYFDTIISNNATKDQEIATLKAEKDSLTQEVSKVKGEYDKVKADYDKKISDERAALVKTRKDELGAEFAKDMKDEDILDDVKFENAKLKKENASLKANKPAQGGLEAGATGNKDNPVFKAQENVQKNAWGEDNTQED